MFTDITYPDGKKMQFQRVSFYMSEVLIEGGGSSTELSDVEQLNLTDTHSDPANLRPTTLFYSQENFQDYDRLIFRIGLTPEQNASSFSDHSASSPLASVGEYWPTWNSYVFAKFEGNIDINNDGVYGAGETFLLHTGGDRIKSTFGEFDLNTTSPGQININIDLEKVFERNGEIYDLANFREIHTLTDENIERMNWLMENLEGAMSLN